MDDLPLEPGAEPDLGDRELARSTSEDLPAGTIRHFYIPLADLIF